MFKLSCSSSMIRLRILPCCCSFVKKIQRNTRFTYVLCRRHYDRVARKIKTIQDIVSISLLYIFLIIAMLYLLLAAILLIFISCYLLTFGFKKSIKGFVKNNISVGGICLSFAIVSIVYCRYARLNNLLLGCFLWHTGSVPLT